MPIPLPHSGRAGTRAGHSRRPPVHAIVPSPTRPWRQAFCLRAAETNRAAMSLPPNPNAPYYSPDPFDPTDPSPNPIDGSFRRRIHLLRHAEVVYLQNDGSVVADPRAVALTPAGLQQAKDVGAMLADVKFDKALCSGLPRTRQTAEAVLAGRSMTIGEVPG